MKNKKLVSDTAEIAEPKNGKATKINGANAVTKAKTGAGSIAQNMLPDDYRPSEDEDFMNPLQLLYFQKKLESWKAELLDDANGTITGLSQENLHQPDQMYRAQI